MKRYMPSMIGYARLAVDAASWVVGVAVPYSHRWQHSAEVARKGSSFRYNKYRIDVKHRAAERALLYRRRGRSYNARYRFHT